MTQLAQPLHRATESTPSERRAKPRVSGRFGATVHGVGADGRPFRAETVLENISASGIYFASADLDRIFGSDVEGEKNLVELAQKVLAKMNTRVVVEIKYDRMHSLIKDAAITRFEISTGKNKEIGLGCRFDKRLSFKEMALLGLLAS